MLPGYSKSSRNLAGPPLEMGCSEPTSYYFPDVHQGYRDRLECTGTLASDLYSAGTVGELNRDGVIVEPLAQEREIRSIYYFQRWHVSWLKAALWAGIPVRKNVGSL